MPAGVLVLGGAPAKVGQSREIPTAPDGEPVSAWFRRLKPHGHQMMLAIHFRELHFDRWLSRDGLVDELVPRVLHGVPAADSIRHILRSIEMVFARRIGGPVELEPDLLTGSGCHTTKGWLLL